MEALRSTALAFSRLKSAISSRRRGEIGLSELITIILGVLLFIAVLYGVRSLTKKIWGAP